RPAPCLPPAIHPSHPRGAQRVTIKNKKGEGVPAFRFQGSDGELPNCFTCRTRRQGSGRDRDSSRAFSPANCFTCRTSRQGSNNRFLVHQARHQGRDAGAGAVVGQVQREQRGRVGPSYRPATKTAVNPFLGAGSHSPTPSTRTGTDLPCRG